MCGIAGIIGVSEELSTKAAKGMLAAMRHRGPDGSGIKEVRDSSGSNSIILLHTRLAILDLSPSGSQPMADVPHNEEQLENWIVFNGEIYNFLELQPKLAQAGWECRTRCDTEVILNAYRVWGEAAVERLRGMFAWCLVDKTQGRIWLCRDRLGIKPLYLYRPASGGLLFASEIRTLLAAGSELISPVVSQIALESFLAQGAVWGSQSIIEGIEILPPGQSLITDWKGVPLSSKSYWQIPFSPHSPRGEMEREVAVNKIGEILRESVKINLLSDVPIGVFLSGGIDSSAIATLATEVSDSPVQTISLGFDQGEFDETPMAEAIAQTLKTEHTTIQLSGQTILDNLPEVLSAIDQPTVDGFNTFFVSQVTRNAGLTVALSGLGGDELFGGYASFSDVGKALALRQRFHSLQFLNPLIAQMGQFLPGRSGIKFSQLWRRDPNALEMYLLRRELFMTPERRSLHPLPEGSDAVNGIARSLLSQFSKKLDSKDIIQQVSLFELSLYMRDMLLRDADVFSMASGLELRVPLLDHKLVEWVFPLPSAWKSNNGQPKSLLIDAVGSRLPSIVLNQPKRGFKFPWSAWLTGALYNRVQKSIQNRELWQELGMNSSFIEQLWQKFLQKDRRISPLQILSFLILEDYVQRHSLRLKK